jgi:uracil phosphoribosyltransferase
VDRGASSAKAKAAIPGEFLDEESGLTDIQYIVPGLGGLGELINNSYC